MKRCAVVYSLSCKAELSCGGTKAAGDGGTEGQYLVTAGQYRVTEGLTGQYLVTAGLTGQYLVTEGLTGNSKK